MKASIALLLLGSAAASDYENYDQVRATMKRDFNALLEKELSLLKDMQASGRADATAVDRLNHLQGILSTNEGIKSIFETASDDEISNGDYNKVVVEFDTETGDRVYKAINRDGRVVTTHEVTAPAGYHKETTEVHEEVAPHEEEAQTAEEATEPKSDATDESAVVEGPTSNCK